MSVFIHLFLLLLLLVSPSSPLHSFPSAPLCILLILQATLVTCVKQYCMCDLADWRREERGSPKSLMTSLSGGWVTTFTPWLTPAAHNHNSLLLLGRYTHFVLIKLCYAMQTPHFNRHFAPVQTENPQCLYISDLELWSLWCPYLRSSVITVCIPSVLYVLLSW